MGKTISFGILFLVSVSSTAIADTSLRCRSYNKYLSRLDASPSLRLVGITTEELWTQFFATRSDEHRNLLVERYRDHVRYQANLLSNRVPDEVDVQDLEQEGVFGLMDAIDAYDPDRRVKFETFSVRRIRGAMLDYLRSLHLVTRLARTRSNKVDAVRDAFLKEHGRQPSEDEILNELERQVVHYAFEKEHKRPPSDREIADEISKGEARKKAERIFNDSFLVQTDSLNRMVPGKNDSRVEHQELLLDSSVVDPLASVANDNAWQEILRPFSRQERLLLVLRYLEDMTLKEIGKVIGLSESRVSQLHASILERLETRGEQELRFLIQAR